MKNYKILLPVVFHLHNFVDSVIGTIRFYSNGL
jgi:hypothetical protein